MSLVELVLAKDAVEDAISIVCVHNALQEVLDRWNDGNMGSEEQCAIGQHCTETTHDEEEKLDDRQQDRAIDKLVEDHSESPVQDRTMLE